MKCPHCAVSISPLSPVIMGPTKPGGARECKACNNKFTITADKKIAVIAAVATAIIGFFVLRPIPTAGPALWGVTVAAVTFIAAARLKKA